MGVFLAPKSGRLHEGTSWGGSQPWKTPVETLQNSPNKKKRYLYIPGNILKRVDFFSHVTVGAKMVDPWKKESWKTWKIWSSMDKWKSYNELQWRKENEGCIPVRDRRSLGSHEDSFVVRHTLEDIMIWLAFWDWYLRLLTLYLIHRQSKAPKQEKK